ncbi:HD family hydrolase [Microvenator marinus]|uniref:5'-deoxynucleotidase n=1 Tax=Microvenator marinus TaxID=2600177 RepID=A0A5B8XUC0_9DELT|nr:HD family hydrolase [Microvenator marinus]QED29522.1 HD family hydrolase [Microvenator marinus]
MQLLDILNFTERLEALPRTGWLNAGVSPCENISSHVFHVALITMWLCDQVEGVDEACALKMALLHDIGESLIGDLTPESKRLLGDVAHEAERNAVEKIVGTGEWLELWERYHRRECPESKVVKAADVIHLYSKALRYSEQRGANVSEFFTQRPSTGIPSADAVITDIFERWGKTTK